ncbi:MAG TPA: hypothetical protein VGH02_10080 [Rhizomicrobium sp.]|jgi:hypothetical protein
MRKQKIAGRIALLAMAAALAGCASAADPNAMVTTSVPTAAPFPEKLQHAMCVRTVTGGESTNPLWVSKVGNDGFKAALSTSLDRVGLSAPASGCSYPIDVNLLGLSQPMMGFDLTVTSHVNYKVYDSSGQPLLLSTIDAPYTAKVGDAFIAVERMKLANEGSIRTSIDMFFDKLRTTTPK